jgi:hypothetical protein
VFTQGPGRYLHRPANPGDLGTHVPHQTQVQTIWAFWQKSSRPLLEQQLHGVHQLELARPPQHEAHDLRQHYNTVVDMGHFKVPL